MHTLAPVRAALVSALAAVDAALAQPPPHTDDGDRLLTLQEASELLGCTRDWLQRRKALPFRVRLSAGQVRFSKGGIERYIASKAGR
jgi:predicted DNA-binding transcriptional regulator AlpA